MRRAGLAGGNAQDEISTRIPKEDGYMNRPMPRILPPAGRPRSCRSCNGRLVMIGRLEVALPVFLAEPRPPPSAHDAL